MKKSKRHMQKMAKLRYAEDMVRMQRNGLSVREIAREINRRLKLSHTFYVDGVAVQLSKTTVADFLKEYKAKRKKNDNTKG